MAELALKAEARTERGSSHARRLRGSGRVPATLYGHGMDPLTLSIDARELSATLHTDAGMNVLIDLKLDGATYLVMARELDRHPVRGDILHVDLLKIDRDQKIQVEVPVTLEGTSKGVKEGGQLDHHLHHVTVECLATAVPEKITVDVTDLTVGDTLRVSDLVTDGGTVVLTGADEVVVSCIVPQEMKVEAELEAPAAPEIAGTPAEEGDAAGEKPAEG